jgi:hypothetical protein
MRKPGSQEGEKARKKAKKREKGVKEKLILTAPGVQAWSPP